MVAMAAYMPPAPPALNEPMELIELMLLPIIPPCMFIGCAIITGGRARKTVQKKAMAKKR